MVRLFKVLAIASGLTALVLAADPVGKASSVGGFEIGGLTLAAAGTPFWPVAAGDEIHSTGAPVVVRFADGSQVTVVGESRVRISKNEHGIGVNLVSGRVQFKLAADSAIQLFKAGALVDAGRRGERAGELATRQ